MVSMAAMEVRLQGTSFLTASPSCRCGKRHQGDAAICQRRAPNARRSLSAGHVTSLIPQRDNDRPRPAQRGQGHGERHVAAPDSARERAVPAVGHLGSHVFPTHCQTVRPRPSSQVRHRTPQANLGLTRTLNAHSRSPCQASVSLVTLACLACYGLWDISGPTSVQPSQVGYHRSSPSCEWLPADTSVSCEKMNQPSVPGCCGGCRYGPCPDLSCLAAAER